MSKKIVLKTIGGALLAFFLLVTASCSSGQQGVIPFGKTVALVTVPQNTRNTEGADGTKKIQIQIEEPAQTLSCFLMPGERLTFEYELDNQPGDTAGLRLLSLDGCYDTATNAINQTHQLPFSFNGGVSSGDPNVQPPVKLCLDLSKANQVTLIANQQGLLREGADVQACP